MNRAAARAARLLWIALLLLLAPACAEHAPGAGSAATDRATAQSSSDASRAAAPPFYRIEGGAGADLLLLGTVHFGPPTGWALSPALEAGIAQADRFVFEIDLRQATAERVGDLLAELAVLEPGRRLPDLVAPETVRLLDERDAELTRLGFPRGARDGREPWYVAVSLVELPVEANGWSLAASVESQLFAAVGPRPITGLETLEGQLRMLDGLPHPLQDLMLRDTLARLDESADSLEAMATAWRTGDEAALEDLAREGVDELPGLAGVYDVLLGERNRRWVTQLRPILEDASRADETVFVAVGALHLVGDEGLVALLREAGYRAESIDQRGAAEARKE
ncbi:MAG: TraB/GumN family protein [Deltaproteobacteria bacterium]|nr:TraB/GumN family protein [Deltaproteobacteria bacterium]